MTEHRRNSKRLSADMMESNFQSPEIKIYPRYPGLFSKPITSQRSRSSFSSTDDSNGDSAKQLLPTFTSGRRLSLPVSNSPSKNGRRLSNPVSDINITPSASNQRRTSLPVIPVTDQSAIPKSRRNSTDSYFYYGMPDAKPVRLKPVAEYLVRLRKVTVVRKVRHNFLRRTLAAKYRRLRAGGYFWCCLVAMATALVLALLAFSAGVGVYFAKFRGKYK